MEERLKELRNYLGMSQKEFAKSLSLGQSTWAMIEVGKRELNDRHVKLICTIYNVSEEWLRYGEGEMIIERSEEEEIAELVYDLMDPKDDAFYIAVVELLHTYKELSPQSQQIIKETAAKFLDNYKKRKGD